MLASFEVGRGVYETDVDGLVGQEHESSHLAGGQRIQVLLELASIAALEELQEIEKLANQAILRNETVTKQYMKIDVAREIGAVALFGASASLASSAPTARGNRHC